MVFYDVFLALCESREITPAQVRRDLSIGQSTMASWKSKGLTPNANTVARLAEYFNVSVDYLLGKDDSPIPTSECISENMLHLFNFLDLPLEKQSQFVQNLNRLLKCQEIIRKGVWDKSIYSKLASDSSEDKPFLEFFTAIQVFAQTLDELDKINPEGIHYLRSKYGQWNRDMDRFSNIYRKLNYEGREEVMKRAEELTELSRYQR